MVTSRLLKLGLIFSIVFFVACKAAPPPAPQPTGPTQAEVEAAVNNLREAYVKAQNAGDVDGLVALFSDDAVLMPANDPAATGKEAIRAWMETQHKQFTFELSVTQAEAVSAGHWAFTRGTYTMKATPKAGGAAFEDKGKYLNIVEHRPDGSWKLARHIWNNDAPRPAPERR